MKINHLNPTTMKTFEFQASLKQFKAMLLADATMISCMNGSQLILHDAKLDIDTLETLVKSSKPSRRRKGQAPEYVGTRYIAVREQGSCYGRKEEVVSACKVLGQPVIIYRIDVCDDGVLFVKKRIC